MNLRSLKVFVLIMQEGTLARAAAQMHLSQSAASRLLQLLEQEFSVTLFRRQSKRLIPTQTAENFLPEALRILSQIDALPEFLNQIQSDDREPLRIIAQTRIVNGLVLPAIARFSEVFPDQPVKLEVHLRRDLGRRMMNDRYDIGVCTLPLPIEQPKPHLLGSAPLKIAVHRDHPLAREPEIDTHDLTDVPYIALDASTVLRRIVDRALEAEGAALHAAHEVSLSSVAYRMVHQGLGFTFADPMTLDPELTDKIVLRDWRPEVVFEFGCFRPERRETNEAASAFVRAMEEVSATRLHR